MMGMKAVTAYFEKQMHQGPTVIELPKIHGLRGCKGYYQQAMRFCCYYAPADYYFSFSSTVRILGTVKLGTCVTAGV